MRGVRPTAAATPLAKGKANLLCALRTRLRKRQRKERGEAPQGNARDGTLLNGALSGKAERAGGCEVTGRPGLGRVSSRDPGDEEVTP